VVWAVSIRVAGGLLAVSRKNSSSGCDVSGLRIADPGGHTRWGRTRRGTGEYLGIRGCAILAMV
jgi:hypothetical protein